MQAYEAQLERLKQALNVDSDTAFSQVLDISQGSVSGAKKRGQIPRAWFFYVFDKTEVSIDWLITGIGAMRPSDAALATQQAIEQPIVPIKAVSQCLRCERLETKLEKVELQRDELAQENRQLWKENGELRERCATLEERQKQCCPDQYHPKKANIPSSDPLHIR